MARGLSVCSSSPRGGNTQWRPVLSPSSPPRPSLGCAYQHLWGWRPLLFILWASLQEQMTSVQAASGWRLPLEAWASRRGTLAGAAHLDLTVDDCKSVGPSPMMSTGSCLMLWVSCVGSQSLSFPGQGCPQALLPPNSLCMHMSDPG